MTPRAKNHIELSRRAQKDLRRLSREPDFKRIIRALEKDLTAAPPPNNIDVRPLVGAEPWLRMRTGSYRIIYRPLTDVEVAELEARGVILISHRGLLVERVVNRRDLDRAVRTLPPT